MLLLRNIIKAEKIEITDADLEFEYSKIADQYKMEIAKVKEILGPQEDHFRNDLLFKRLEEFLVFNNTK
jgi:trigger factor